MAHWESRHEEKWKRFHFKQPYARGLQRLQSVLAQTDFDPATLWQWGTMQATALLAVLKRCEQTFGEAGQRLVCGVLRETGRDVGRQILDGAVVPDDLTEAEFVSFYATVINRIAYASLEDARIDRDDQVSFDILWCPHQDHYGAFDCRVQRYFVQGMIDAARELGRLHGWQVRFDTTIPSGAPTCHFSVWRSDESDTWEQDTGLLEARALTRERARR